MIQVIGAWRLLHERRGAIILAATVTLQAALGIVTLLYEAPLAPSLAHQVLAIVVFTAAVAYAERLSHHATFQAPQLAAAE
jgi:cytochrome c oxidase assembly protein subunit 15